MAVTEPVVEAADPATPQAQPPNRNPSATGYYPAPARGFAAFFGLHPPIAFLTFIVDSMLFAFESGSLGLSLPFSLVCAAVLGNITYKAQRKFFGDDHDAALVKSFILAFLTAIPSPIPSAVYITAGLVGLCRRKN